MPTTYGVTLPKTPRFARESNERDDALDTRTCKTLLVPRLGPVLPMREVVDVHGKHLLRQTAVDGDHPRPPKAAVARWKPEQGMPVLVANPPVSVCVRVIVKDHPKSPIEACEDLGGGGGFQLRL